MQIAGLARLVNHPVCRHTHTDVFKIATKQRLVALITSRGKTQKGLNSSRSLHTHIITHAPACGHTRSRMDAAINSADTKLASH